MARFYLAEIVVALEYIHHKDILYRDLKPENVMLDERGHIKLADFGVSKVPFKQRQRTHSLSGSLEYMSPEMLSGDHAHGREVDIYAMGALLYEMLAGTPPHVRQTDVNVPVAELCRRIREDKVEYPR